METHAKLNYMEILEQSQEQVQKTLYIITETILLVYSENVQEHNKIH